jgi:hypothetical protein
MPRKMVEALHTELGPAALAYSFGVSADAMHYRLVNLKVK